MKNKQTEISIDWKDWKNWDRGSPDHVLNLLNKLLNEHRVKLIDKSESGEDCHIIEAVSILKNQPETQIDEQLFRMCFFHAPPCPDSFERIIITKALTHDEIKELTVRHEIVGETINSPMEKKFYVKVWESAEERELAWRIRFACKSAEYLMSRDAR